MDREKVIKGLEQIINDPFMKAKADYWVLVCTNALALLKEQETVEYALEVLRKAGWKETHDVPFPVELLKEQEAVEPEVEVLNEIDRLYRCPKCHKCFFYRKQKYCDQCGQAVKW